MYTGHTIYPASVLSPSHVLFTCIRLCNSHNELVRYYYHPLFYDREMEAWEFLFRYLVWGHTVSSLGPELIFSTLHCTK